MNSTLLALLNFAVTAIFKRLFASIDEVGLEKVASYAKRHPVVLVPSHRSYFDFLMLSWLFYAHHLVPPHIAARENMGFGPFGFIFRRAGAFFMRARFDDPLYKEVFRRYLAYLVKEGFTQEFFIEGGRSRTGKTLAPAPRHPRLEHRGLRREPAPRPLLRARGDHLRAPGRRGLDDRGARGRREEARERARPGARAEAPPAPVRQRVRELRRADLAGAGARRRRASSSRGDHSEEDPERRAFVERLGNELAERINWAMVANSTSVVAAAFLGEAPPRDVPRRAHRTRARRARPVAAAGRAAHAGPRGRRARLRRRDRLHAARRPDRVRAGPPR